MNKPVKEMACPCCSGKEYLDCCKPFHEGKLPKTASQLMRSRYSAYALSHLDYIIETTHPANPQYTENKFSWKRAISKFCASTSFQKLSILDCKEKNTLATVVFAAYIYQGQEAVFTEKSYFEKIGGKWLYLRGEVTDGLAQHLATQNELKLLPLAYYDNPILRKQAEPVERITNSIRTLVEEMIETMEASCGIGLAAPQVKRSLRLFIIRAPLETPEKTLQKGPIQVFIDPILLDPSEETWKEGEGCLSIPSLYAPVKRPKEVTVRYRTLDGAVLEERFSGWSSKIIQHENDHLDGVLFFDRLEESERSKLMPLLEKIKERMPV